MRANYNTSIYENDKIMNIIEKVFNATTPETAVSMEEIINKGIEMGLTFSYPRGRADGHPWWPRTSVMAGVGSVNAVMENEEKHLFRQKMSKNGGHVKMYYWVDRTREHEVITRKDKADKKNKGEKSFDFKTIITSPVPVGFTGTKEEELKFYEAAYPGKYVLVKTKTDVKRIITKDWIAGHPDKFEELYGGVTL